MNSNVESDQPNTEAVNQADAQPSSQGGVQQSSQPNTSGEFVSKSDFDKSLKRIEALISGVQGDKDRLGNRNEKEISEIKTVLEQVGKWDLSPDQKAELGEMRKSNEFEEFKEEIKDLLISTGTAPAGPAQQTTDEFLTIISEAELDPNDPEVIALAQQHAGNRIAFGIALGRKSAATSTLPLPTAPTTPAGMGSPPPETEKQLTEEFIKKGGEALTAGKNELYKQLKEQYRNLGVQVDYIQWDVKPEY